MSKEDLEIIENFARDFIDDVAENHHNKYKLPFVYDMLPCIYVKDDKLCPTIGKGVTLHVENGTIKTKTNLNYIIDNINEFINKYKEIYIPKGHYIKKD